MQTLRASILAMGCTVAIAMVVAQPSGPAVVAGSATFSAGPGALTISQASGRAIINWQEFSIAAGEAVRFVQPDALSATLNRVVSGAPSNLLGNLEANGSVYLINPNGVVIGAGARIDTNGFLASTLDVSDAAFLKGGDLLFRGDSTAAVQNLGAINALGGDVFLIARRVENSGTIAAANGSAKLTAGGSTELTAGGTVGLAAGSEVLLTTGGSERVFVQALSAPGEIVNAGQIAATSAELKAAGGNAYALAINHSGVVRATGSEVRGGQVWLVAEGGDVQLSGRVVATQGERGGEVQVRGDDVALASVSSIDVSGAQRGGRAIVVAENRADFAGEILARGKGFVEVSGKRALKFAGRVDTGGGTLLIDPAEITVQAADGDGMGGDTIGVGQIATLLLDNHVILDASNDITWEADAALDYDGIGADERTLTLQAGNAIRFSGSIADSVAGGDALNVVFNSDRDGLGGGNITLNSGSSIVTNGGSITLGGGEDPLTTAAIEASRGVQLDGATLSSGSGAISIRGTAATQGYGVDLNSSASIQSTSGAITIVGIANGSGSSRRGISLHTSSIETETGAVSLRGTTVQGAEDTFGIISLGNSSIASSGASGAGAITLVGSVNNSSTVNQMNQAGVDLETGIQITSVSADISVTGTGGTSTSTGAHGIALAGTIASSGAGAVVLNGTAGGASSSGFDVGDTSTIGSATGTGDITITANTIDLGSGLLTLQGTGALLVQPVTASTSIGLGSGSGTLSLTQTELDTFADGFSSITIGRSNGTGEVRIEGAGFHDPLTIQTPGGSGSSGGEIVIDGDLSTTGSLKLLAGHNITVSAGSITSDGGDVVFNSDRDASGYGAIRFAAGTSVYSNGGDITLRGGNAALDALPDPTVVATEENFIFNGGLEFTSARGDEPGSHGIALDGVTLNAGGGDIVARGIGGEGGKGIFVGGDAKINTTGGGAISLFGAGGGTGNGSDGVYVGGEETVIGTVDGAITFYGLGRGGNSGRGVVIEGVDVTGPTIESEDGNIVISGASQATEGGNQGVLVTSGGVVRTLAAGGIEVNGGGGSGDGGENTGVDLRGAAAIGAEDAGNVIVEGVAGSGSLGVRLEGATLGASTGTGDVTVTTAEGFAMGGGSWMLIDGGTISVDAGTLSLSADSPAGLMAYDDGTLLLSAASGGIETSSETAIEAGAMGLSGAGDFIFEEGSIYIDTLAADVTGNLTFATAQALTVGTAGALAGITASGDVALTVSSSDGLAIETPVSVSQKLTLSSDGGISASASVEVGTFQLDAGDWSQVSTTLPAFAAEDFRLSDGTFVRALGGDGTSGSPYQLSDVYGLQGIRSLLDRSWILAEDIDASGTNGWNDGAGFLPIGTSFTVHFTGNFDGADHVITGLAITTTTSDPAGLFGYARDATIKNVGLEDVQVNAEHGIVGTLIGYMWGGSVEESYATGSVTTGAGTIVGGLVGEIYQGASIAKSYATTAVTAVGTSDSSVTAGGLVGEQNGGSISESYAAGAVSGDHGKNGGLVGTKFSGSIADSYATGTVSGSGGLAMNGGLVGSQQDGTVQRSYATGAVSGASATNGGLVGALWGGSVSQSYATGAVSGDDGTNGGLAGSLLGASIEQTYATGAVAGSGTFAYNGGLVGGQFSGSIFQSYATGAVTGAENVTGGLVGNMDEGTIAQSYASGAVSGTGESIGGLVGSVAGGELSGIEQSWWDKTATGQSAGAGLLDEETPFDAIGLTTAEARNAAGFMARTALSDWNFTTTWAPPDDGHYAQLYPLHPVVRVDTPSESRSYGAVNPTLGESTLYGGPVSYVFGPAGDGGLVVPTVSTTATDTSDVGDYAFTGDGPLGSDLGVDYRVVYTGAVSVTPAPLTVTASNTTRGYGEANPSFGATYHGFVLDQNASVLGGALAFATDATTSSPRGNYTITPSGLTSTNYAITFVPGTLSIDLALLTITANNATKLYGAGLPNFSASFNGFVDGDDAGVLGGALTFATAATAASDVGSYDVLPGGYTSDKYSVTFVPGVLNVTPAPLVVKANDAARVFRNPNPTLSASYEGFVLGQNASVLGGSLALSTSATIDSAVGNYAITASGLTSSNYAIRFVDGALSIGRALLTVRADDVMKLYGAALPGFTASFDGFEPGDTVASSVTGSLTFTTAATVGSGVGRYSVVPGGVTAANYAVEFVPGTLTISPAALTIVAHDATRFYGAANPSFSASFAGFVNGDDAAVLSGVLAFATEATTASKVGAYAVTPSGVGSANYAITFVPGTLTIGPAALTITAEDYVRVFGAANPTFTARYDGLVNGESASVVSGLSFATNATPTSVGGTYAIVPGGATAANYAITFVPGSLVVSQVVVIVDDEPAEVPTVGGEPALTGSYAVVVRGDSLVLIPVDGATGVGGSVGGNLNAAMENAVTVSRFGEGGATKTVGEVLTNLFGGGGAMGAQVVVTLGGAGGAGSGGSFSLANVPSDQNLMRETTVNMGGFNVVYREAVDEVKALDAANTAFGSSFREFLDSENPQVVIVRDAPGQNGPDKREHANETGAAL